ncbi:MAG: RluA family pseudouridine synthase [Spirochaetes bacterium]|nr:RluA family pseudouridine synthase [Spirochaetota bacterium]
MNKKYIINISERDIQKRLDIVISNHIDISRSAIKSHAKSILVNGKKEKLSYLCKPDDEIELEVEWEEYDLVPQEIPLNIIYEDQNYIVINKPAGMVVHPAAGNYQGTIINALLGLKKQLTLTDDEYRPGIVHRLDKDTSGILVVTKNPQAHSYLSEQFKNRKISKIYQAIVKGFYTPSRHTLISHIGRDRKNRKKMAVLSDGRGKEAVTEVEVIKHYDHYTHLKIKILTGRTHQIRVHLSHHGFPVLGDPLYSRKDKNYSSLPLCLVAKEISFFDQSQNKNLNFEIPLPDFFSQLLT